MTPIIIIMTLLFVVEALLVGGFTTYVNHRPHRPLPRFNLYVEERKVSVCQICGCERNTAEAVKCVKCRTHHHEDCFKYNGQCSTYGCGSKNYL